MYRRHLDPQAELAPKYNIIRHAGTMYALGMSYQRQPRDEVRDALLRARNYLFEECVGRVPERPDLLAVWSYTWIEHRTGLEEARLGGAGLGLVGLLQLEKIQPGTTSLEDLRRLGEFILYMQKPDGSFYSEFVAGPTGRTDLWTSLYYPGEAALGLVVLFEHDGDAKWLSGASRTLAYLSESRKDAKQVPADHWALLATARIWKHAGSAPGIVSRETLRGHTLQVAESILREQQGQFGAGPIQGCFTADGRTCPSATRLEGLLAAREVLSVEDSPERARIERAIHAGMRFLVGSQVEDGDYAGGIPRAVWGLPRFSGDARQNERPNRRAGEIRVDYVQHALSAFIQYENWRYPR